MQSFLLGDDTQQSESTTQQVLLSANIVHSQQKIVLQYCKKPACKMSCPYNKESDYQVPPPEDTIEGAGEPIPHPPEHWFLGNLPDVDSSWFENSLTHLAKVYGPIFSLNLVNRRIVVVSSQVK
jgi:hypothetical protein